MSSLIIGHDSHLMMLEVGVDKLCIPSATRFDDVVLSKSIVSFRFLDIDPVDITPNRRDYKKYRGSAGPEQCFYGGKSVVFAVSSSVLTEEPDEESAYESDGWSDSSDIGKCLEITVRREISAYFKVDKHTCEYGMVYVNVCELFYEIVGELKTRRELDGYLTLAHERDPISRSTKNHYELENPETCDPTGCHLDLYVRLSYLGGSVITEIDRPLPNDKSAPFYAQEETNLSQPYECIELNASRVSPKCNVPILTRARCHDTKCECTDEQRYRLLLAENMRNAGTCPMPDGDGDGGGKGSKSKKKKKGSGRDQSTGTGADTDDKSISTDIQCGSGKVARDGICILKRKSRSKLSAKDLAALIAANKRGASVSVGIVDKQKPCEPCIPCVPCEPCVIEPSCIAMCSSSVGPSTDPCPTPVCCLY